MSTAVRTPKRLLPSDDVNAYQRWVTRQKAYGRWQPFVDAQPARAHFLHVMASTGAGWRQLADRAGVPRSTVTSLLYGSNGQRSKRITPENARRLLNLRADQPDAINQPSAGTQRRIQVLMGEGWPQVHLGPQFGTNPQYVSSLLRAQRVTATTAESVADAYERLRNVDPLTCGATAHGVGLAKRMATLKQWPDRTFWDDCQDRIDDPDFDPATVLEDTLTYMRVGEDAIWLRNQGFSLQQVADRLGQSTGYVATNIRRYLEATTGNEKNATDGQVAA